MVSSHSGPPRAGQVRGPAGGEPVVWWLAVSAAGFVASTALVIALALPATARWEREEQIPATRR
jgi:hypothetical protein